jgi:hypothetical protein
MLLTKKSEEMKNDMHWDESDSIQLIRSMIEASKYQVAEGKFLYFLWGYGVVAAGPFTLLLAIYFRAMPTLIWFGY